MLAPPPTRNPGSAPANVFLIYYDSNHIFFLTTIIKPLSEICDTLTNVRFILCSFRVCKLNRAISYPGLIEIARSIGTHARVQRTLTLQHRHASFFIPITTEEVNFTYKINVCHNFTGSVSKFLWHED